jgi:flagellar hook-associated protein FlgK
MSGISSTLSIAKTAIAVSQYGLNITGQNIANVNNPNYSVQSAEQQAMTPAVYSGFLFGTGVDMFQVAQSVDQLLEQRLTDELSTQSSYEEQESYMRVLESFFDVDSNASISNVLTEFWNSWQDLSDNPAGSSERVTVFENGIKLGSRFEALALSLDDLSQDITSDIDAAVIRVNSITSQIADLNLEITGLEINRTANDQRDQRNALLDELGKLIDINVFEQPNGAVTVNSANGFTIVNGVDTYNLTMSDKEVAWQSSMGGDQIISDRIKGGRLGGLLEMRDEIIPKYRTEIDELAREMIWALNYQNSQGVGMEYYTDAITGDYKTDESGWLSSYEFGDKIDYTQDFTLWTEDTTYADTQYTKTSIDMGISEAAISDWQGTAPGTIQSIYRLTVVDEGILGDSIVTESDGDGLGLVHGSTGSAATTLNAAIADQVLTVYGSSTGTSLVDISDAGGDAYRSAFSIAASLNDIQGVEASASENSASFDITGILNADNGDEIQFSLYVDGVVQQESFIRDSQGGTVTLQAQFENALLSVTETVNTIHEDQDLSASGLAIYSDSGKTLGIQDFEVVDNTGVRLDAFANFNEGDVITFTVESSTVPISTTQVSVNLTGVDITDQAEMASVISDAMTSVLAGTPFSVEHDPSTNSIILRSTDRSDIILTNAANDTGNNASIDLSTLAGTNANAGNTIDFSNPVNSDTFVATTSAADTITFFKTGSLTSTATVAETTAGAGDKSAVITGTVTVVMEPQVSIQSSVYGAGSGGIFSDRSATLGSSIITLGGVGGFSDFAVGDVVTFDVNTAPIATTVTFTVPAGATNDLQLAAALEARINIDFIAAGVDGDYEVVRTGASVSIIKDISFDEPIEITNFSDAGGNNATLAVSTGTGTGSNQPENELLESGDTYRDSATSSLYKDEGIIMWEKLNRFGLKTGETGLITVEDEGSVSIMEGGAATLTFEISKGSLVAGNTLTVNTDTNGQPDPLNFTISGQANSINSIYTFTVKSGGVVGVVPGTNEEPLTIEWDNGVKAGSFVIEGHDPPYTPLAPVEVSVDGMLMRFYDGTLFSDDVFTVTTGDTGFPLTSNSAGIATGEKASDWHWTTDSFSDQFNREAAGIKASTTLDNRLKFSTSDQYHVINNIEYSEENGFCEANCSIEVKDQTSLDFETADLRFVRAADNWGVVNDPTGGRLALIPPGGDDDGFGVDFTGDGLADIQIKFDQQVSGDGFVEFDFQAHSFQDIGYAFASDDGNSAGLVAAAGVNTFFKGSDAMTMEVNQNLSDTKFMAGAVINNETGEISQGDNTNALAMSNVQFKSIAMELWNYTRGIDAESSQTTATLDDYYNQMIGSLGIRSRLIKDAKEFSDVMVNNLQTQRDSISAVSLDEEMIELIKYQHAFSAASKLLTVSDEMLNTLIAMR